MIFVKKFLSRLLITVLVMFLFTTNPTVDEFADWYVSESFSDAVLPIPSLLSDAFSQHLAEVSQCSNYLLCSVFRYNDSMVLGIGHRFYPVDELSQQFSALQEDFAVWAEQHIH